MFNSFPTESNGSSFSNEASVTRRSESQWKSAWSLPHVLSVKGAPKSLFRWKWIRLLRLLLGLFFLVLLVQVMSYLIWLVQVVPWSSLVSFVIVSEVTEDNEPTLGKHPSVTDLNYLDSKCWNSTCIFLIESSGRNYILPRYQCAIEAAARHHPHRPIILLTAAYQDREQRPLQEILNAFPNIHVVPANFQDFLQGTQLQDLYLRMKSSKYLYVHLADIWRVGVLYRYGGIYIDLDLITLQNYDQLPDGLPVYKGTDNVMESIRGHLFWLTGLDIASLSLERKERLLFVTNSFMKFSKQKHNLLSKYFQKISSTTVNLHCYWCVGPHAMSNVVMRWCPSAVSEVNQFTNCSLEDELFVYPEKTVHPIPWFEMKKVFSAIQEDTEEVVDKIFDKSAFAFHISNHAFKWGDIWYLQNTAYSIVALKECPVAHRYLLSTRHL